MVDNRFKFRIYNQNTSELWVKTEFVVGQMSKGFNLGPYLATVEKYNTHLILLTILLNYGCALDRIER